MQKSNSGKRYLSFGLYGIVLFIVHVLINNVWTHLSYKELIITHFSILALYSGIYYLTNYFRKRKPEMAPMVTFGSITVKMLLMLFTILILYMVLDENKKAFIFSFLAVYLIYLPLISYFYIRDLK